jgi:hypothetical protein
MCMPGGFLFCIQAMACCHRCWILDTEKLPADLDPWSEPLLVCCLGRLSGAAARVG